MSSGTKNQVEGKLHEAKGAVKAKVGELTNNPTLEAEGHTEKLAGKLQSKVGEIQKVLGK